MPNDQTTVCADVVTAREVALKRGMANFRAGRPRPADRWTEEEWSGPVTVEQAEYLGWMLARGSQILKAERIRQWAEEGAPLP